MEFSDFFDMLWTYLGDPDESKDNKGRPKFFCHLIDLIIRTPQTDVEDKKAELKQLEDENKNYQKKKKLQQDKKDQRDALNATVNNELSEVQHSLNTKMASLNEQVCGSNSFQPPRIELKPKEYNFETINDQGTGT